MHVCLLTSGRIFESSYGGEEKYTISIGNWLLLQNIDVTIIGSTFAWVKSKQLSVLKNDEIIKNNGTENNKPKAIYPPYPIYLLSRLFLSVLWIIKIVLTHRKFHFTLIHAQDTGYSGIAAIVAGKILGIPTIISSHGIRHKSLETILQGKFKKFLLKIEYKLDIFTVKNSKKVIVDNPAIKNYYEKIVNKKIDFIPIPIKVHYYEYSPSKRNSLRNELNIPDFFKIILFVGRLSPEKNLITLMNSFIDISAKYPSLILLIVGSGIMESQLKEFAKGKEFENKVIFCGSRSDVDRFLSCCDIFVLPSFIEGMSTALLEAMACNRAIICSDISANRQLVSCDEAIFFNPSNGDELKIAILKLLKDDNMRQKLGDNAKKKTNEYDENIIFPKIIKMYESSIRI
jgi:glycosyltransferase involved in cell wall biosynthesis